MDDKATKRALAKVKFRENVQIDGYGICSHMEAGVRSTVERPGGPRMEEVNGEYLAGTPPPMYRDAVNQEIVIGKQVFPLSGGLIHSYEFAVAVAKKV